MARQINHVVLIGILLISAYVIEGSSIASWVNDFNDNLNKNINRMMQQINNQINQQIASAEKYVEETLKNLPRDAQGNIISSNGSIISVQNGTNKIITIIDGVSRIITSGQLPNGTSYVHDVVEERKGNMLYRNETTCYPETGACETNAWKRNLAIPGAKPEIITDTKQDEK